LTLDQLKTILGRASEITSQTEFYVIGSSAILAVFESPTHPFLTRSNEADLVALSGDPKIAEKIGILMGELSPFHDSHDVYADGCTFETPTFAPEGWNDRTIAVHYPDIGVTAHYMELHDLFLSKIGAGRPKDNEFCSALVKTQYIDRDVLEERLPMISCTENQKQHIRMRIDRLFA
jgi:hypothetical protein